MTQTEQTLQLIRKLGIVRPHELAARGISPITLYSLHRQGKVQRIGRGLYTLPTLEFTEHHSLAEANKRDPHGVVCLLSALQFHNLGTQNPAQSWLAIDRKARRPQVEYPPLRVVRFSGAALTAGVEDHQIEGISVRVYAAAKTVADCFKYRNKIGLDVAVEALRDCLQMQRCTHQELWHYAQICRVSNIIKPYLEALA